MSRLEHKRRSPNVIYVGDVVKVSFMDVGMSHNERWPRWPMGASGPGRAEPLWRLQLPDLVRWQDPHGLGGKRWRGRLIRREMGGWYKVPREDGRIITDRLSLVKC